MPLRELRAWYELSGKGWLACGFTMSGSYAQITKGWSVVFLSTAITILESKPGILICKLRVHSFASPSVLEDVNIILSNSMHVVTVAKASQLRLPPSSLF